MIKSEKLYTEMRKIAEGEVPEAQALNILTENDLVTTFSNKPKLTRKGQDVKEIFEQVGVKPLAEKLNSGNYEVTFGTVEALAKTIK